MVLPGTRESNDAVIAIDEEIQALQTELTSAPVQRAQVITEQLRNLRSKRIEVYLWALGDTVSRQITEAGVLSGAPLTRLSGITKDLSDFTLASAAETRQQALTAAKNAATTLTLTKVVMAAAVVSALAAGIQACDILTRTPTVLVVQSTK